MPQNKNIIALILILIISVTVYANSLQNPFIWDDEGLVEKNHLIRNSSNFFEIFKTDLFYGCTETSAFYRPLQNITYLIDYQIGKLNPLGYHITNILLHSIGAFLFFLLLSKLSKDFFVSLAASLLFTCHPIATETVTYISGRADSMVLIFMLLSLIFYRSSSESHKKAKFQYLLSMLCFIFALLSKELAIVFPALIFLTDLAFPLSAEKNKSNLKKYLPFILITILYVATRAFFFLKGGSPDLGPPPAPFYSRILTFAYVVCLYLGMLVCPINLHMRRSIDDITTIFDISIFSSVVAIVLILILLIYCFRKNKLIFFSGFWFFVALLPQSGLFPINASIAEHFIYVSSIGYFIILTLILKKISYRKITYALLIILLSTYSFLTFQQNKTWKDPVAFYKRIIHFEPFSSIARSNLGNIYQAKRQYILAEIEYMQAYTINNTSFSILASLASLYSAKGDFETALSFYNKIDQLYPNVQNAETLTGRGLLCLYTGKTDKAIEEFNHALSVNPTLNYIHLNLAAAYYAKEEYDKSKSAFYASLGINISSRIIQDQLLKNEEHKEIFSVNSPPEKIYTDIGMFHAKKGQLAIAKACFEKVISLFPEKPDPYFNLGLLYLQQGSINAAKQQFKTTLKKDSSHKPSKEWLLRLKNK